MMTNTDLVQNLTVQARTSVSNEHSDALLWLVLGIAIAMLGTLIWRAFSDLRAQLTKAPRVTRSIVEEIQRQTHLNLVGHQPDEILSRMHGIIPASGAGQASASDLGHVQRRPSPQSDRSAPKRQ